MRRSLERSDLQAGYVPSEQLGRCARWVSDQRQSWADDRRTRPFDKLRARFDKLRARFDRLRARGVSDSRSRWAYLAVITPIIFGTTYLLTTEFLPPGRPLLAALMRSLPTGHRARAGHADCRRGRGGAGSPCCRCSTARPSSRCSSWPPTGCPGGVAAVINSLTPIIVVILSVPWLHTKIKADPRWWPAVSVCSASPCWSCARPHGWTLWGLLAMTGCVIMMAFATVLTKRWGLPPGMNAARFTGWTFLLGGLTLLPFTLIFEGLPASSPPGTSPVWSTWSSFSGIVAYGLWFWGLQHLSASSVTFLSLLNPVVAALLGWVVLSQTLNGWQIIGAVDRARVGGARPGPTPPPARGSSIDSMSEAEPPSRRPAGHARSTASATNPIRASRMANERTFLAWIRTSLAFPGRRSGGGDHRPLRRRAASRGTADRAVVDHLRTGVCGRRLPALDAAGARDPAR